jgi:isopenicillin N synthase-like dioxygenase
MKIPLLDASKAYSGPEARKQYCQQLCQSLTDHGFVRLINHPVPDEKITGIFEWVHIILPLLKQIEF